MQMEIITAKDVANETVQSIKCRHDEPMNNGSRDGWQCLDGNFEVYDMNTFVSLDKRSAEVVIRKSHQTEKFISVNSEAYCVGSEFLRSETPSEPFTNVLAYCPQPCNGQLPCIRTCAEDMVLTTRSSFVEARSDFHLQSEKKSECILDKFNLTRGNLHKANSAQRRCPAGYRRFPLLEPRLRCGDAFELEKTDTEVVLRYKNKRFGPDDFCLYFNDDHSLSAEICQLKIDAKKFS